MSKHSLLFGLVTATALVSGAAQAASVEVIGADNSSFIADVQSKLQATGKFSEVDVFNSLTGTPTLSNLQSYSSVLVYNNYRFANATALSNELDAYLRGGGGVVLATGDYASGYDLKSGAFANDYALNPNSTISHGTPLTLGQVHVPGSPLLAGVASFNGGSISWYDQTSLVTGAVDVADWSNGVPLVATRLVGGYQTVDLNFFPPSSDLDPGFWTSSTDGAKLMANALLYAGTPVPEPASLGVLATGVAGLLLARRRRATA